MMNVGSNRVDKIMVGASTVYQDSDGWIPLELPDGVNGAVFFKDNGDGTAGLIGVLTTNFTAQKTDPTEIIIPPEGYAFSSVNWPSVNSSMSSILGLHDLLQSSSGIGVTILPIIADGKMYAYSSSQTYVNGITLVFSSNTTEKHTDVNGPAIVGITKV